MARVAYYPGCALKERSSHLEASALSAMEKLGLELDELDSWTCCGAVPPPTEERLSNIIPQARILKDVRDSGDDELVTICDFCYNSLKRANYKIEHDDVIRKRVNAYLREDEPQRDYLPEPGPYTDYNGDVAVLHLLEYLRDVVGFDKISEAVSAPLEGLVLAPYYGCVMLRPEEEIGMDSPENPSIIEDFISALGAEPIDYPYRTVCCGSYLSVSYSDSPTRLSHNIISAATERGAEAIIVSCPLCFYNLDARQDVIAEHYPGTDKIPVLYFTQLLALALGADRDSIGLDKHHVDPGQVVDKITRATNGGEKE